MRKDADLSQFIIIRVDIVKAFDYMSRGPHDPAGVDRVKHLHGNLSAQYLLHVDRHHWLVYTHRGQKHSTEI